MAAPLDGLPPPREASDVARHLAANPYRFADIAQNAANHAARYLDKQLADGAAPDPYGMWSTFPDVQPIRNDEYPAMVAAVRALIAPRYVRAGYDVRVRPLIPFTAVAVELSIASSSDESTAV